MTRLCLLPPRRFKVQQANAESIETTDASSDPNFADWTPLSSSFQLTNSISANSEMVHLDTA